MKAMSDTKQSPLQELKWFMSDGLDNLDEGIKVSEIWDKTNELIKKELEVNSVVSELTRACLSLIEDFEGDYVLNGEIVDNPSSMLVLNYELAKEAINKLQSIQ